MRFVGKLFGVCVLFLTLVGSAQAKTDAVERIKKEGKLLVAIDATYPPMEFEDDKGKPDGFDVEFAKSIAKELGVNAEFIVMGWDGILAGLNSKRYDVIISSMNITPERKQQVDFVEYAKMSQLFVSKKGISVATVKDLAGKTVAVQADTTSFEFVEKQKKAGIAIKDIKAFRLATDVFAAVTAGQAETIVIDEPVGRYYAAKDPNSFVITGRAMDPEPIGIAIRKDDKALTQKLDQIIGKMKKDGSLTKLSQKWFGGNLGS
ncbi:MAG: ABC transporter substrate-binding protein [Oligoflexales bacterium]